MLTLMLTRITCPNCGHVGATAASLPRVLICSRCGHGAFIRSGRPSPSITRDEQAAAWERYVDTEEVAGTETAPMIAQEPLAVALPHFVRDEADHVALDSGP